MERDKGEQTLQLGRLSYGPSDRQGGWKEKAGWQLVSSTMITWGLDGGRGVRHGGHGLLMVTLWRETGLPWFCMS